MAFTQINLLFAFVSTAVKVDCKTEGGFKQNPLNCARYFVCSPQMVHQCVCPDGQKFDEQKGLCNWANQVKCPEVIKTSIWTTEIIVMITG